MSNATQQLITDTLQRRLRKEIVTENLINRDLAQGEITGPEDTVKLLTSTAATVTDYTGGPISIESYDVQSEPLAMDHKKAFAFVLEGTTNLQRYVESATNETFAEVLEQAEGRVLQEADPAKTGNMSAGDITYSLSADDVEDKVADAAQNLDENGVPNTGRVLMVTTSATRQIEDKIAARETVRGDLANEVGFRGMFRGFEVYDVPESLFPKSTGNPVGYYGSRLFMGYADAVVNVQVIEEAPGYPGGIVVQGLHVAGAKTAQSDAFGRFEIAA